jgi:alpha-beta hydrolase superfamily lysophospholipase
MQATTFGFERPDGVVLFVYRWLPNGSAKAVVQIVHGWGEHAGRYARVAEALCREGYGVYANDHRGHGRTARTPAELGFSPGAMDGTTAFETSGSCTSTSRRLIAARRS